MIHSNSHSDESPCLSQKLLDVIGQCELVTIQSIFSVNSLLQDELQTNSAQKIDFIAMSEFVKVQADRWHFLDWPGALVNERDEMLEDFWLAIDVRSVDLLCIQSTREQGFEHGTRFGQKALVDFEFLVTSYECEVSKLFVIQQRCNRAQTQNVQTDLIATLQL